MYFWFLIVAIIATIWAFYAGWLADDPDLKLWIKSIFKKARL